MKYRNHARVRAATRAGEPVRLCARGQAAPPPNLAGQPAMSFTSHVERGAVRDRKDSHLTVRATTFHEIQGT